MDLASMIYEKAKAITEAEKSKNYIEIKMNIHIHGIDDKPCYDKEGKFRLYPIEDDPGGVKVILDEMTWVYRKKAYELDKLILVIFRQILREFIEALEEPDLIDEILFFEVWYKQKRVFFDEYLVMDSISILDLSNSGLYDCNENDELACIQRMFQSYMEICMGMI